METSRIPGVSNRCCSIAVLQLEHVMPHTWNNKSQCQDLKDLLEFSKLISLLHSYNINLRPS